MDRLGRLACLLSSKLDFCSRPARKGSNVPLLTLENLTAYYPNIYTMTTTTYPKMCMCTMRSNKSAFFIYRVVCTTGSKKIFEILGSTANAFVLIKDYHSYHILVVKILPTRLWFEITLCKIIELCDYICNLNWRNWPHCGLHADIQWLGKRFVDLATFHSVCMVYSMIDEQ